jgi:hypothetical protein
VASASSKTPLANRTLPAIFAVVTSLAALPASAIELGELTVQSRLGQPLQARVAYALGPNEQISNDCVTMRPGASVSGFPGFGPAQISVANGVIMLAGSTPIREPMVSAHVVINCPYSAKLNREYLLFIDPLSPAYDQTVVTQQATPAAAPVAVAAESQQRPLASVTTKSVVKDISRSTQRLVQAGDTISDIASPAATTNLIIDADLEAPTTTSTSPNVTTAIITAPSTSPESSSWLFWLAGSGIAMIVGLLMFGRRFRGQTDTTPLAPVVDWEQPRRFSDTETTDTGNVEALDFDLTDESPTEENLALDADLVMGTGLEESKGSSTASDFGFAATTNLDFELPFEAIASEETNILPPLRTNVHSILESEVMPEYRDDYDMSVIVDATKMPQPEDVTKRDLKAVEVAPEDETLIEQNYTISKQVNYQVLEQDYVDEFSATQALNHEIARAALELSERMESDNSGDLDDLDATGVNEAITFDIATNDETVEIPVAFRT